MAKNTEKPSNGEKTGRDSKGKFVAGNKGGGRKAKPSELKDIHRKTIPELMAIAFDAAVNVKVRADVLKWLTEMDLGKPKQAVDAKIDDNNINVTVEVIE